MFQHISCYACVVAIERLPTFWQDAVLYTLNHAEAWLTRLKRQSLSLQARSRKAAACCCNVKTAEGQSGDSY